MDSLEGSFYLVRVMEKKGLEDCFVADLWMRNLPKKGDYIEIPEDTYRGRQIAAIIHPLILSYDLIVYLSGVTI